MARSCTTPPGPRRPGPRRGAPPAWGATWLLAGAIAALAAHPPAVGAGEPADIHWIMLAPRPAALGEPAWAASPRALERLRRAGTSPGEGDRPVHAPWVRAITALGITPRAHSRWLHAVSATLGPDERAAVLALPFVERVVPLPPLRRARRAPDPVAPASPGAATTAGAAALGAIAGALSGGARALETATPEFYGPSYHQLAMLGIPELHARGLSGQGVLIASLDSGFHYDHPAFAGLDLVAQRDFVNRDGGVQDGDEGDRHGTVTLSVLAGWSPGELIGAAPGASVALARTEVMASETLVEIDYFVAALEWADSLGADVVTASLGYLDFPDEDPPYAFPPDSLDGGSSWISRSVNRMAGRGMLAVLSAGNSGPAPSTLLLPADSDSGLAVGSVYPWGEVAVSSSRGPTWNWDGERVKPDVCAQGDGVRCATWSAAGGAQVGESSGTSLATPLAAGLAALVLEARPELRGRPLDLIARLHGAGDQAAAPDNDRGHGVPWGPLAVDPAAGSVVIDSIRWLSEPRVGQWTAFELRLTHRGETESPAGTVGVACGLADAECDTVTLAAPALLPGEHAWVGAWEAVFPAAVQRRGRLWVPWTCEVRLGEVSRWRSLWAEVLPADPALARSPLRITSLAPQPWRAGAGLEISYVHRAGGPGAIEVYDLEGRRAARLATGVALRRGVGRITLGPEALGRLPGGRYVLVLSGPGGSDRRPLVWLR